MYCSIRTLTKYEMLTKDILKCYKLTIKVEHTYLCSWVPTIPLLYFMSTFYFNLFLLHFVFKNVFITPYLVITIRMLFTHRPAVIM